MKTIEFSSKIDWFLWLHLTLSFNPLPIEIDNLAKLKNSNSLETIITRLFISLQTALFELSSELKIMCSYILHK